MEMTTVGLDLAKNVFQVHAVDRHGKVTLKKQLKRGLTKPPINIIETSSGKLRS
jgi:transposase